MVVCYSVNNSFRHGMCQNGRTCEFPEEEHLSGSRMMTEGERNENSGNL